jgi:hypothetical protein
MEAYGLASFNANVAQKVLAKGGMKMSTAALQDQEKANLAIQKLLVKQGQLAKKDIGNATGKKLADSFMWQQGIMDSAFTNAKGNFEKLGTISGALQKHLATLNDTQRQQALTTIFGSDASRAAAILMKTGKTGIDKYTKATSNQSAAQKVANARMKGTAGAIEQLKGSVETVLLRFGQAIAPAVQGGLKLVTKGVNGHPRRLHRDRQEGLGVVAKWKITPMGKKITNAFKGFNIRSLGTSSPRRRSRGRSLSSTGSRGPQHRRLVRPRVSSRQRDHEGSRWAGSPWA